MVPPSPPTPVSKLMPQLFLGNEDTTSSIAVRFLLAVILLVRKFLNTQRITHVVICGTGTTSGSNVRNPSTFLASPAKHVSRVCSFLDKALDGDGVILLVSGACDGSDVAEPADSDEAIESFTLHKTSFKQAVRLAPCVVKPKSSSLTKPPQTSEPTRGTGPTGSILRLGDARRHRTPLKLAKTSALLSRVARPLTSACRSYTPLGLGVPQINVRNVPSFDEFGPKHAFAENERQIRLDHSRTACPAAHTHTSLVRSVTGFAGLLLTLALPATLLAPTAHPSVGSGLQHRPLSPLVAHTHKPPFASEGPRELERTAESCSCDDAPVLAREWDALAATLEASPKVGLAPHNPSHTLPLFPKYGSVHSASVKRRAPTTPVAKGKAVAARQKHHF
ncbi:hypothetical protein BLNAU_24143 [Blattamonas nauphoetae]|uniref:Uncharacterized protein n=1 Tax=Blattamonas nauphoetae TaxID=2049346 RepID=A0ABQ9WSD4_9EUKA|nr:hypothetical protein BLNAU_24143 [Blattamonas nauphoetae]